MFDGVWLLGGMQQPPSLTRVLRLLRALLLGAALLGSAALGVPAARPARAAILPSCTIQRSDLRHGYLPGGQGYSLIDLAALQFYVSLSPYDDHSALVSYSSSFDFPGAPAFREIEDSISLYGGADLAHLAYRRNLALIPRWHRAWSSVSRGERSTVRERWIPWALPIIGSESAGWQTETQDTKHAYSVLFIFFREGSYLAGVRLFGARNTVTSAQVEPLARLLDWRIRTECALG